MLVDDTELLLDVLPAGSMTVVPERVRTRAADLVATSQEFLQAFVWHVLGYEGTGLDAGSNAGIFTTAGAKLGEVGDMTDTSKMIDVHNSGGQTVAVNLSTTLTLNPGIYYVAFRFVIGAASNAPIMMCADSSNAAPVTTLNSVKPFGVISGLSSWPGSITPSAIETDPIKYWAAFA
ncbi:hypothetical protein SMALB_7897 [Streptomyces malaysiensis]|uniref:Uncharacterized protein n=1 Tax=Streptomyces malaysiensis TaxID=92644 RepID=A0A7X6B136_STRMQ|nr:hypothetical protein [Streptomyces malaysiensis]